MVDDIWLHYHHHPRFKRDIGRRLVTTARQTEHGWQIPPAIAMDQIIAVGEAKLFDNLAGANQIGTGRTGCRRSHNGFISRIRRVMQRAIKRRRFAIDGKAAQDLTAIVKNEAVISVKAMSPDLTTRLELNCAGT